MGRRKEPINLILAKGKSHKTKQEIEQRREQEIAGYTDKIEAPSFLSAKQKRRFNEIAAELMKIGIMTNLDCDVLGRYIRAETDWVLYSKLVSKMQTELTGMMNRGDLIGAENATELLKKYEDLRGKAFNMCQSCARSLGLTISDRCRIVLPEKQEAPPKNKYSEFIS